MEANTDLYSWEAEIRGFKGHFCMERHACCWSCLQTAFPFFATQMTWETS